MKEFNIETTKNYDTAIRKNLKKQYSSLPEEERNVLYRELIFAPNSYKLSLQDKEVEITELRQNFADFIERDASTKNFIPYSLDVEIADLIESTNCETSSMNEYYRWVGATSEIIRHTTDGEVTEDDLAERNNFITLSYDRETLLLLCLALYEGAGNSEQNKEKIHLLRFKLARLRELRSIIKNTTTNSKQKEETLEEHKKYLKKLLSKEVRNTPIVNFNLSLNLNDDINNDLHDDYSHLENLRFSVLFMMRLLELKPTDYQHENKVTSKNLPKEKETKSLSKQDSEHTM